MEALPGGLVGELGEAADELLVEVAHLEIRDDLGVQVDVGEAGEDEVEQVGAVQAGDLHVEVELVDHLPGAGAEPGDVFPQAAGELAGVAEQAAEVERAGVVEALTGDALEHEVGAFDALLESLRALEHRWLGLLQHAVQTAQHGEREDHLAVLRLLVVASQEVGDGPDEGGVVVDGGPRHAAVVSPRGRRQVFPMSGGYR